MLNYVILTTHSSHLYSMWDFTHTCNPTKYSSMHRMDDAPAQPKEKSALEKYLALNILWTREVINVCSRHPCIANKAKLKTSRSPKPKPPFFLGRHIYSQLSQAILFLSFIWPHQNLRTILVISSQRVLGNLKTPIVYVGIA